MYEPILRKVHNVFKMLLWVIFFLATAIATAFPNLDSKGMSFIATASMSIGQRPQLSSKQGLMHPLVM